MTTTTAKRKRKREMWLAIRGIIPDAAVMALYATRSAWAKWNVVVRAAVRRDAVRTALHVRLTLKIRQTRMTVRVVLAASRLHRLPARPVSDANGPVSKHVVNRWRRLPANDV